MAASKVLHGSGTVHDAVSTPVSDTALRLFWAFAAMEQTNIKQTARNTKGERFVCSMRFLLVCEQKDIAARETAAKGYLNAMVEVKLPSLKLPVRRLFPNDRRSSPPWLYTP